MPDASWVAVSPATIWPLTCDDFTPASKACLPYSVAAVAIPPNASTPTCPTVEKARPIPPRTALEVWLIREPHVAWARSISASVDFTPAALPT